MGVWIDGFEIVAVREGPVEGCLECVVELVERGGAGTSERAADLGIGDVVGFERYAEVEGGRFAGRIVRWPVCCLAGWDAVADGFAAAAEAEGVVIEAVVEQWEQ